MQIYGESQSPDCPLGPGTAGCYCPDHKYGFMLFGGHQAGKALHPDSASSLPIYKIKSYATYNIHVEVTNVKFIGFAATTACGGKQYVIERNPSAADYIPFHLFKDTTIRDVAEEALIWIEEPDPAWAAVEPEASPDNCGNTVCTAPDNVVLKFEGSGYEL